MFSSYLYFSWVSIYSSIHCLHECFIGRQINKYSQPYHWTLITTICSFLSLNLFMTQNTKYFIAKLWTLSVDFKLEYLPLPTVSDYLFNVFTRGVYMVADCHCYNAKVSKNHERYFVFLISKFLQFFVRRTHFYSVFTRTVRTGNIITASGLQLDCDPQYWQRIYLIIILNFTFFSAVEDIIR
jgi:hypothetical protein